MTEVKAEYKYKELVNLGIKYYLYFSIESDELDIYMLKGNIDEIVEYIGDLGYEELEKTHFIIPFDKLSPETCCIKTKYQYEELYKLGIKTYLYYSIDQKKMELFILRGTIDEIIDHIIYRTKYINFSKIEKERYDEIEKTYVILPFDELIPSKYIHKNIK